MTTIGTTIDATIETADQKRILVLKIDLDQRHGLSRSGKSVTIASSEGNQSGNGAADIKIGLNVYQPQR
jgi:hypothetical protein